MSHRDLRDTFLDTWNRSRTTNWPLERHRIVEGRERLPSSPSPAALDRRHDPRDDCDDQREEHQPHTDEPAERARLK
jgi:hypothetical protein